MEGLLRVGGLERRGRGGALIGGRQSCVLGRWRGRAVPLGYTPAQAALPGGARQGP